MTATPSNSWFLRSHCKCKSTDLTFILPQAICFSMQPLHMFGGDLQALFHLTLESAQFLGAVSAHSQKKNPRIFLGCSQEHLGCPSCKARVLKLSFNTEFALFLTINCLASEELVSIMKPSDEHACVKQTKVMSCPKKRLH